MTQLLSSADGAAPIDAQTGAITGKVAGADGAAPIDAHTGTTADKVKKAVIANSMPARWRRTKRSEKCVRWFVIDSAPVELLFPFSFLIFPGDFCKAAVQIAATTGHPTC
jgi:hypothetical protein